MRTLLLIWATTLTCFGAETATSRVITFVPREETNAVLRNPDMGWVLYENYPLDQQAQGSSTLLTLPDEDFPGVDHVALMSSWADVEQAEGEYDFSKVNHAYDYWRRRGKKIQLRVSAESLLWWAKQEPPRGVGIPEYVLSRIPPERKQTREFSGLPYTVVDARDPFYGERLFAFLRRMEANFSGARRVTVIDLRGFGLWGEWHSGYQYASVQERREALSKVIDIWSKALPKHFLSLSYSYDPDGPPEYFAGARDKFDEASTKAYAAYLRFSAFDHALTKPNIALRRDGCGGAVTSNERRLCEEAFATLTKGPFMSEFLGGFQQAKKGKEGWVDWMIEDALSLHPNYVCLLGWQGADARDFLRERADLIDHGLRHMGYRLVPVKVSHPLSIVRGAPFKIEMHWVNRGVGRALRDFRLRLTLHEPTGAQTIAHDAGTIETSKWVKGRTYDVSREITFKEVMAGEYDLRIAVIDPQNDQPIMLPLAKGERDGSYPIGRLTIAPSCSID